MPEGEEKQDEAHSETPNGVPPAETAKRKPMKVAIGNLTEKNVGQLKKLNIATFPVNYPEQFYQDLLKQLEYSRLGYFLDILIAGICCRVENRSEGGKKLYIMTLSVLRPYRCRGVGEFLMDWVLEKLTKDGKADDIQDIYLHVQTSNEAAIRFYRKYNFEIVDEIKGYYKTLDPPDCYILQRAMTYN